LSKLRSELQTLTDFIPLWVKIAVAVALGLGTTIGWKRIVVTVGEKIGKSHLTYAQGASAELVAMTTIGIVTLAGFASGYRQTRLRASQHFQSLSRVGQKLKTPLRR
jgi:phosphate/sulfate permease